MSPRWATVAGYGLYFYAAERHLRPHVDVRRGGEHATLDVMTGEVLAGALPPRCSGPCAESSQSTATKHSRRSTQRLSTGSQVALKQEETMSSELAPLIEVRAVRVLGRYTVELTFADGAVRVIDLEPFLRGEMFDAITKDYELFLHVSVDPDAGTIVWPTGADLSPRTLYSESKPAVPASAPFSARR